MEFLVYKVCDKLIWTSGIYGREIKKLSLKRKISTQVKNVFLYHQFASAIIIMKKNVTSSVIASLTIFSILLYLNKGQKQHTPRDNIR